MESRAHALLQNAFEVLPGARIGGSAAERKYHLALGRSRRRVLRQRDECACHDRDKEHQHVRSNKEEPIQNTDEWMLVGLRPAKDCSHDWRRG
jgi:hypothetical protein